MSNSILSAVANGAIVGVLLTIAVWAGLKLTPRRTFSAAARYLVWWTALVAVAVLPIAYLPARTAMKQRAATAATATPALSIQVSAASPVAPAIMTRATPARFPIAVTAGPWTQWILLSWGCLSLSLLLRLAMSCFLLARRKSGAPAVPASLAARIEQAFGKRRAAVLRSTKVPTPVLAGLCRPAILIPDRLFKEMTDDELTHIALHEAAHLARCDDYALVAQRVVEAVLPFHPAVRWIVRQIDLERETACDDSVVAATGAARDYAESLLHTLDLCGKSTSSWTGAGVIGLRSQLSRRVDRLLDRRRTMQRNRWVTILASMAMVAVLASVAARTPRTIVFAMPMAALEPAPEPAGPQQPANPPQTVAPVMVPVTVRDLAHRYVGGLNKESFRILEDGVEQPIVELTEQNSPLSVMVIVDASGSMRNRKALVETTIQAMMKSANPADEFVVINANTDGPAKLAGRTPAQALAEVQAMQPHGGTTIRDAVLQARNFQAAYPDRMMVLISDGQGDNASQATEQEFREAVISSRAPLWAITLAPEPSRVDPLAELSEGHEFATEDAGQLAAIAASLVNRTSYLLKYVSSSPRPAGTRKRIQVQVVSAPAGTLKLTHRMYTY